MIRAAGLKLILIEPMIINDAFIAWGLAGASDIVMLICVGIVIHTLGIILFDRFISDML